MRGIGFHKIHRLTLVKFLNKLIWSKTEKREFAASNISNHDTGLSCVILKIWYSVIYSFLCIMYLKKTITITCWLNK